MKKQYSDFMYSYNHSNKSSLSDCYGRYSSAKAHAYEWCREKMANMHGFDFRILSHNTFMFTCAWQYVNESGVLCMDVETPYRSYNFEQ